MKLMFWMPKYIINSVDMNFRKLIIVSISSYVILYGLNSCLVTLNSQI